MKIKLITSEPDSVTYLIFIKHWRQWRIQKIKTVDKIIDACSIGTVWTLEGTIVYKLYNITSSEIPQLFSHIDFWALRFPRRKIRLKAAWWELTGRAEEKQRAGADLNRASIVRNASRDTERDSVDWRGDPDSITGHRSRHGNKQSRPKSQCGPDDCGSIKEKVLQWISVWARLLTSYIWLPQSGQSRPKPNGPLWPTPLYFSDAISI